MANSTSNQCLDCPVPDYDIKDVLKKLIRLRQEGYGKLTVEVKDGRAVYTTVSVGEQIRMELDDKKSGT